MTSNETPSAVTRMMSKRVRRKKERHPPPPRPVVDEAVAGTRKTESVPSADPDAIKVEFAENESVVTGNEWALGNRLSNYKKKGLVVSGCGRPKIEMKGTTPHPACLLIPPSPSPSPTKSYRQCTGIHHANTQISACKSYIHAT